MSRKIDVYWLMVYDDIVGNFTIMGEALFMFGVPSEVFRNMGVSFTPKVAFPRNSVKGLPMLIGLIVTASPYQRGPVSVTVESDGELGFGTGVNNKIILKHLVVSAMEKKC